MNMRMALKSVHFERDHATELLLRLFLMWSTHPVIAFIRDAGDFIKVLLH